MRPSAFASLRLTALAAAFTATAAACARNPVTGQLEPALISESQEVEMGRQAAVDVQQSIGLVEDDALQRYVQEIGASLAAGSQRPDLPWTFRVVDDPTPNAFALPGGFIFVTRGMLNLMENEAQLASVLGHEIGHVTARHSVQMISRQQLAQLGLGIGMILVPELQQFGDLAATGLQLLFLRYSRDAEHQSDELGYTYARAQGYDVREMPQVFASLARVSQLEERSPLPEWLSTHPYPEERIERINARLQQSDESYASLRDDRQEYMGRIEGLVYGEDPREGYFQGSTFIHPELRFRMTFPSGWQVRNTKSAVIATSPQQDAAIQLTLAQQSSPDAAAQAFLAQQGIQPGQASRETVNSIPAVAATFQANTQQGVVQGLVVFLGHGGNVYQVMGFSPAQIYAQHDRVFRQSLGSFGPVTDPALLSVEPARIEVVRADRAMTLAEFNQRYPSTIPLEELAIINQVTTNSTIPAGTLVKRVAKP
jgi:predicted Zn-dependent protease